MPNLDYFILGKGEPILFLHGWGQNKEMMYGLANKLKYKYQCILIDMPGFGNSNYNGEKDVDEYCKTIHDFLLFQLKINPQYIVGHSFGGKVAIQYYLKYQTIKAITFIASPILKPKRNLNYYYRVWMYKIKKHFNMDVSRMGSSDYKNVDKKMKHFFINVVNTHYDKNIKKVKVPALLLYSKEDKKVDFSRAKKLNKLLDKSQLKVMNGDHFAYLGNESLVVATIHDFFKENDKKREYYL